MTKERAGELLLDLFNKGLVLVEGENLPEPEKNVWAAGFVYLPVQLKP